MSHKMSVRKIKGMYNSTVKSVSARMGIGKDCKVKKEPKPKPEPAVDRNLRVCRKAVDDAGRHFHDDGPKDARTFKALKKKLDIAIAHCSKAYVAWERANRCG